MLWSVVLFLWRECECIVFLYTIAHATKPSLVMHACESVLFAVLHCSLLGAFALYGWWCQSAVCHLLLQYDVGGLMLECCAVHHVPISIAACCLCSLVGTHIESILYLCVHLTISCCSGSVLMNESAAVRHMLAIKGLYRFFGCSDVRNESCRAAICSAGEQSVLDVSACFCRHRVCAANERCLCTTECCGLRDKRMS